jgi:putative ABC transport system substrate-binding protein
MEGQGVYCLVAGGKMNRRVFVASVAGAALAGAGAWGLSTYLTPARKPVIGYIHFGFANSDLLMPDLQKGLARLGYIEGQNVIIERRYANDHQERVPDFARELAALRVDVIAVGLSPQSIKAVRTTTPDIPLVFLDTDDPVATGVVQSYNSTGGNLTGITLQPRSLTLKRLELLDELMPKSGLMGYLTHRDARAESERLLRPAAQSLGHEIVFATCGSDADIESAFSSFAQQHVAGVAVHHGALLGRYRTQIQALAGKYRMPAVYPGRLYVVAGGLVGYGTNLEEFAPQFGEYVGRVLKGEPASELPVLMPAKFQLVVNLKAARAQALTIPASLVSRADEVIE